MLHPSSSLKNNPLWVIYGDFVITKYKFIRTVTGVCQEWLVSFANKIFVKSQIVFIADYLFIYFHVLLNFRLVDIAPRYYDHERFPQCETERVLEQLYKKHGIKEKDINKKR